jgi:precorrin-6B methylase 2
MNIKLLVGRLVNKIVKSIINSNHKLLNFLPNGRYLSLDIKRSNQDIKVVFDVGANIGQTATTFNDSFTTAQIYSFEPVKNTFESLVANTRKYDRVKCFQLALGETNEFLSIECNADLQALIKIRL